MRLVMVLGLCAVGCSAASEETESGVLALDSAHETPVADTFVLRTVPRVSFVALRPEQGEKALAGAAEVAAYAKHGEDRPGPSVGQDR